MTGILSNKVTIVTGGGRGIGRAIALGYAREGAKVLISARTQAELEVVAAEIRAASGEVLPVVADISHPDDAQRMVSRAVEAWGGVDVLVNNAGVPGPQGLIHELALAEVDQTWAINIRGTFLCCQAMAPVMLKQGGGNIINMSSGAGQPKPRAKVRSLAYQVSKFAIEGLTNALAVQFREHNINVNALQPGMLATRLHDSSRSEWVGGRALGQPEEAVPAALFLAALAPGAMTGFSLEAPLFNKGFRPDLRDYTVNS
ncbi:MAG: SDR family oxidoreductase [Anaerolineae bacterium]